MNKLISIIAALVLFTGCATTSPPSAVSVSKTAATVQAAAQIGVRVALKKEPKTRPYFVAAVTAFDLLLANGEYAPDTISASLATLPVKELKNEDVQAAIETAVSLYRIHFADVVGSGLDRNAYVRPVLKALRDGIAVNLK